MKNFDMDLSVFDDVTNACYATAKVSLEIKSDIMEVSRLIERIFINFYKIVAIDEFAGTNDVTKKIKEQLKVLKNWCDCHFKELGVDDE